MMGSMPMPAEFNLTEYHQLFVNKYYNIVEKNGNELARVIAEVKAAKQYLSTNHKIYESIMGIDFNNYPIEFKEERYNPNLDLYYAVEDIYENNKYPEHRIAVLQLVKYIEYLGKKYDLEQVIDEYTKYSTMYRDKFNDLVKAYYCAIGNYLIKGYGYKASKGIGIFYLEKIMWSKARKVLNVGQSQKNKKKLILEGKKVYNKKDEYMAKLFGVEYNPEEYRVYDEKSFCYKLKITNSAVTVIPKEASPVLNLNYHMPQRKQVKGITMSEIAANPDIKTANDILDFNCGLGAKLYILDKRFPETTVNLIRHKTINVH